MREKKLDVLVSGLTPELLDMAKNGAPEGVLLLSIMDHKRDCLNPYPSRRVLRLCFDDATETSFWQNLITVEQAETIRDFVLRHLEETNLLIVHCTEGVSRSAAVAAAVLDGLDLNSGRIWNDPCYRPNPLVYKLVLEAFNRKG